MAIKKYKPTTSGLRQMSVVDYSELTKKRPEKRLLRPKKQQSGRNNQGHVTVRHRGGGVKRKLRMIDNKRFDKLNISAVVKSIEYDPNRTSFIALVCYDDGEKRYILAPEGLKAGMRVICSPKAKVKLGNRMQIRNVPIGFDIHDVEIQAGCGGQMVKTAGSSGKVTSLDSELAQVTLPSGTVRYVPKDCYATIGVVSNPDHSNVVIGKAGRMRLMGWRPTVLGIAMNACDHPHGGGEGHSPIGLKHPKTPWGAPALGVKTRNRKKWSNYLIVKSRRRSKK